MCYLMSLNSHNLCVGYHQWSECPIAIMRTKQSLLCYQQCVFDILNLRYYIARNFGAQFIFAKNILSWEPQRGKEEGSLQIDSLRRDTTKMLEAVWAIFWKTHLTASVLEQREGGRTLGLPWCKVPHPPGSPLAEREPSNASSGEHTVIQHSWGNFRSKGNESKLGPNDTNNGVPVVGRGWSVKFSLVFGVDWVWRLGEHGCQIVRAQSTWLSFNLVATTPTSFLDQSASLS